MSGHTAAELLAELHRQDVKLWREGDQLRYSAPKGVMNDTLRSRIAARKAEIIQFLEEAESLNRSRPPRIEPTKHEEEVPLAFSQEALWFLEQFNPGTSLYNLSTAQRITGPFNPALLKKSLMEVANHHDSLRMTFYSKDGTPRAKIATHLEPAFEVIEAGSLTDEQLERLFTEELGRPFDLTSGPLLRGKVWRLGKTEHVLMLTMHHIISDGWSVGLLLKELAACYNAFNEGKAPSLPVLPIQYADYTTWQRQWLQGEVLQRQIGFWKEQLADAPPILELPGDRPRPVRQSHLGGRVIRAIDQDLAEKLRRTARTQGCTLFMLLLAAYQALLYRYTGQNDILVGTPIAGRDRLETEGLIGYFVNTLVLRTRFIGNPRFRDVLARVRETVLSAFANQYLPFEKLVEELRPTRQTDRNPLVQVMFAMESDPTPSFTIKDLASSRLRVQSGTAKFDLTLFVTERAGTLETAFEYSAELFDRSAIERLSQHYLVLLQSVVSDPCRHISKLPLLAQAERQQLLVDWNDTEAGFPRDATIHRLLEEQVEKTPEAVALLFEHQQLTYGELNARANQLAHHLQALGVGPDTLIAICVERSLEMVVGLLAILKADGAYVPLDPGYPQERLAFMLEDTNAPVLLTQSALLERLPAQKPNNVICLDHFDWDAYPIGNPISYADSTNIAYVIYTSGSTGAPKGVMVEHRAVNRLVINCDYVKFGANDFIAQVSNISFDAATFEIWGALLNGGKLVVIAKDVALSPNEFARTLEQNHVTTLFLTTALFNLLVDIAPSTLGKLKHLLFGGEAVDVRHVRKIIEIGKPEHLLHVYGPTETTTFATWHEVATVPEYATTVPIGRPIANTRAYVLDSHRQPVPIGVAGELYIGGPGVARGYLNRPELTSQKFIPDPFSDEPGALLYKTGDVVRFLSGGNMEFLGRSDRQIKLRGFRIEPEEIETLIRQHTAVRDCTVVARTDTPGNKRLVGYVVSAKGTSLVAELHGYLGKKLPDYMIPSAFVMLGALPLTPNGKIDRDRLPEPHGEFTVAKPRYVAPRDALETCLVEIWERAFDTQPIGIHDNFFDLGGHSLLAVRLLDRIEKTFGKNIHLNTLWFGGATIEYFAGLLRAPDIRPVPSYVVSMRPSGIRPALFCVHTIGGGNLFHYEPLVRLLGPDQPAYGLKAQGIDDGKAPHSSVEHMATHCI
ncbi:MAG: amino acid adenylation domain-containing protein, partial [Burkholderiales bacterium]